MSKDFPAARSNPGTVLAVVSLLIALTIVGTVFAVVNAGRNAKALQEHRIATRSQLKRIAEDLDARTSESGAYIRPEEDEIKDCDPWGTRIAVSYSQGGIAEMISVRSAGPDRQFHTPDDIEEQAMSANFKGIGHGIKENAATVAADTAKGFLKGTIEGVKEAVKENLPVRKKKEETIEESPLQESSDEQATE